MAVLTTKKRNSLKSSVFAEPKQRKYPITDKAHAVNAKARATQMVKKGKLSKSAEQTIDAKANKMLKKRGRPVMDHVSKAKHEKLLEKHEKLKGKHAEMKEKHHAAKIELRDKLKAKLAAARSK